MRVAGIGLRRAATLEMLQDLLSDAEAQSGSAVAALAAPDWRADHPALLALAARRKLPLHLVAVAGIATPTQSPRILARHGTGSVAEAAALAVGQRLILPRLIAADGMATIAISDTDPDIQGMPS
ncbi:cobalamin biosynthesis protein [Gemmobacter serpentinus]|uniref:cobalamin biosynthesis protein n=1 Tax=Gemmobacter serpentinus TaxID=2652247 RepID=UPI00124C9922|nr:cobalamin biosynthesis protein [Gemmobacter serpentinus]